MFTTVKKKKKKSSSNHWAPNISPLKIKAWCSKWIHVASEINTRNTRKKFLEINASEWFLKIWLKLVHSWSIRPSQLGIVSAVAVAQSTKIASSGYTSHNCSPTFLV